MSDTQTGITNLGTRSCKGLSNINAFLAQLISCAITNHYL